MQEIKLAHYDEHGFFLKITNYLKSQLTLNNGDKIYYPENSTDILPPRDNLLGYRWQWNEEEWQESEIPLESEPEPIPVPVPDNDISHVDRFLLNASQSELYRLGKNAQGQARREFEEVREIINGRMLFIPSAISDGGLLQKNLRELVAALGDVPQSAIAEFDELLNGVLGVNWTIIQPETDSD